MLYKYMKKSKKDKNLLPKKKTINSSSQEYQELDNLLVQFFIIYDENHSPNVLMNFKGFDDKEHCQDFINQFKENQNYNEFDIKNETIH